LTTLLNILLLFPLRSSALFRSLFFLFCEYERGYKEHDDYDGEEDTMTNCAWRMSKS
jgi:hypothetical protein